MKILIMLIARPELSRVKAMGRPSMVKNESALAACGSLFG
jgi:hypothetical protein